MFAYNRNYEEVMSKKKFLKMLEITGQENPGEQARFKVFTFEFIVKKMLDFLPSDKAMKKVKEVANWKIQSTENILRALLKNNLDELAK